jgi:hypothetical protein
VKTWDIFFDGSMPELHRPYSQGDTMNNMKVIAKREEVLTALRTNREEHQQILKEARAGYVQKAREALSKRLDQLASGKLIALHFDLVLPLDYTKEYDAAIRMLGLHQEETVTLDESMVRCLVLNEWGWMSGFLTSNSAYSNTARSKLSE